MARRAMLRGGDGRRGVRRWRGWRNAWESGDRPSRGTQAERTSGGPHSVLAGWRLQQLLEVRERERWSGWCGVDGAHPSAHKDTPSSVAAP